MRAVNLLKVAARAEVLRLQHMMKRQGVRAAYGLIAAVFALGVLVLAHVAGWQLLRMYVDALYSTLILLGIDLVLAAIFGLMAAKSSPSRAEREALDVRQRALSQARSALALTAVVPIAGALLRSRRGGGKQKRSFWRLLR
jgi:arginine exporter protein ArgO